jgi:diguanylate cyclase (GGDEF)-like protein/PAS domain S-box-containing protein
MNPEERPTGSAAELEKLRQSRDEALQAARSAVRDTSRVNRILTVLNESGPRDFLLEKILTTISELFSADIVILFDPVGSGNYLPIASVGLPEDYEINNASRDHLAPLFTTYLSGTILNRQLLRENPIFNELSQVLGVETATWIPMKGSRKGCGAIMLARCLPTPFTPKEMDLLSAMAYRIALTLEQIQSNKQLEHIVRGNQKIGHHLEKLTIENEAIQAFPDLVCADGAVLYCCRENYRIICANVPDIMATIEPEWSLLAKTLSAFTAIGEGKAVSTVIGTGDIPFPADSGKFPYAAVLAAPMFRDGQLQSLLCAFRSNAVDFTAETKQIAVLYSGQIAAALENAHLYCALRDELRERSLIEASLRESESRFKALIRNISNVIAVLNQDTTIRYVNETAAKSLWGQTAEQLIGTPLLDRAHPDDLEIVTAVLKDAIRKPGENISAVIRMREGEADAWRYFDVILTNLLHDDSVKGIVSTFHDVTERKILEKKLTQLALHDPLTGLSNRASFIEYAEYALRLAVEKGTSAAMIFFDLDNFKYVNDTFGHAAGDETLRTIAARVKGCLRTIDLAARIGGDEFTILIENIQNINVLRPLVDRILETLMTPVVLNGTAVTVGGSMGVAISAPHEDSAESLLHKADLAMYRAKHSGKGRYTVYGENGDRFI